MSDEHRQERYNAQARLRNALLVDKFAGPIMHDRVKAEQRGMRDNAAGLAYAANPYDDPVMRWHWVEGFSIYQNMKYPTYRGSSPRIPRPPKGSVV